MKLVQCFYVLSIAVAISAAETEDTVGVVGAIGTIIDEVTSTTGTKNQVEEDDLMQTNIKFINNQMKLIKDKWKPVITAFPTPPRTAPTDATVQSDSMDSNKGDDSMQTNVVYINNKIKIYLDKIKPVITSSPTLPTGAVPAPGPAAKKKLVNKLFPNKKPAPDKPTKKQPTAPTTESPTTSESPTQPVPEETPSDGETQSDGSRSNIDRRQTPSPATAPAKEFGSIDSAEEDDKMHTNGSDVAHAEEVDYSHTYEMGPFFDDGSDDPVSDGEPTTSPTSAPSPPPASDDTNPLKVLIQKLLGTRDTPEPTASPTGTGGSLPILEKLKDMFDGSTDSTDPPTTKPTPAASSTAVPTAAPTAVSAPTGPSPTAPIGDKFQRTRLGDGGRY